MAELLYRLAKFSARRALWVLAAWLLLVLTAGSLALTSGAKLSTAVALDGIPSQQLIEDLQVNFAEAGRGSGQIVFHKPDGSGFTEAERAKLAETFAAAAEMPGVDDAVDPFTAAQALADQIAQLEDGRAQLTDGRAQLVAAEAEIEAGFAALTEAEAPLLAQREQLVAGIDQLQTAGLPAAELEMGLAQLDAGLAQIAQQREALEAGLAEVEANRATLDELEPALANGERLLATANGFSTISADGNTALGTVFFNDSLANLETPIAEAVVDAIRAGTPESVQVEFPQELVFSLDGLVGAAEIIGLIAAIIVLLVMLRTVLGAALPVISAITGVAVSASIVFALASQIEMNSVTPVLGVMLGLAVGIDYSLFILNRHRRQLRGGMPISESIGIAAGTSGNAVVFAGFTVIIALLALNLTGIGFLGLMGTMGAGAIVIAVLAALTLLPAALGLSGLRILSKRERTALAALAPATTLDEMHEAQQPKNSLKPVLANRHPWLTMLGVGLVLGIAAIPAASLRLGLPDGGSEPSYSTQFKAYQLNTEAFGAGTNGRIITIVTLDEPLAEAEELGLQADVAEELFALDGVNVVLPSGVSDSRTQLMFLVIPETGPASEETQQLVYDIRDLSPKFASDFGGSVEVTGLAPINIDTSQQLGAALPVYLATVIVLSFLLLTLVFRSLVVPFIATAGFLLTVFATLGAVVAVYQWGWLGEVFDVAQPGPILSFVPTILIGVLFGLAMDYQLFLVSGMREAYAQGKPPQDAINFGVHLGRAVVIAAAIIMITVFGGFAFSHITMVRPMGFGLAIGVLIDAFLVRLLLMPALMTVLGKHAWWLPKWLDRLLPDVDVEGAKLERRHSLV
jgi:putative drug exporter of the RND superfamily